MSRMAIRLRTASFAMLLGLGEIGRASCRERV